jgi:hypothetical protein
MFDSRIEIDLRVNTCESVDFVNMQVIDYRGFNLPVDPSQKLCQCAPTT